MTAQSEGRPDGRGLVPIVTAAALVAVVVGPLLVGIEPVGGDPDRVFRPVKAELARALHRGTLPFWSDRFGLGLPLLAESEAGAFYPPNHVLYRFLDVDTAYRLSMWLHMVVIAAGSACYALRQKIGPWGAGLVGVAFPFCGFLAIHSSHEWSYQTLAYLPLALWLTDLAVATGRLRYAGALALVLGVQWTLGHFQMQAWTNGLVLLTGTWKALAGGVPRRRVLLPIVGIVVGTSIAAAQLGPSWELAKISGHTRRGLAELGFYHYPLAHFPELAIPRLFRDLPGGEEDPYWFRQGTTGFESAFYVGTIPIFLAVIGLFARNRALDVWRFVAVMGVILATMPGWAPGLFARLIELPVLGHFRCPSRYTVLASFALCLLAGAGFDRGISSRRFRLGGVLAVALVVLAFGFGTWWIGRPPWQGRFAAVPLEMRLGPAVLSWMVALGALALWRARRLPPAVPLVLTAVELGILYYTSTTGWGRPIQLPDDSPVLKQLAREPGPLRVGGVLDNLPVRVGMTTGSPYFGFTMPPPQPILATAQRLALAGDPQAGRWLRRLGVTHLVVDRPVAPNLGTTTWTGRDPAMDVLARRDAGIENPRKWRIVTLPRPFPAVRLFPERETGAPGDLELLAWDGRDATIAHGGECRVMANRTYYPGWTYRVNGGPFRPVSRLDEGLQGVVLGGRGRDRVTFRYEPTGFRWYAVCSLVSFCVAMAMVLKTPRFRHRNPLPPMVASGPK